MISCLELNLGKSVVMPLRQVALNELWDTIAARAPQRGAMKITRVAE